MISVVAIVAVTFFSRALFRLLVRDFGTDNFWHLYCIDEIRKNKNRIPFRLSRTLTAGFFAYPFFVHWLLSFLKKAWVERIEPYFGAFVDSLHALVVFFGTLIIFQSSENSLVTAFIAALLFCFYPILIRDIHRTFALSPRVFGSLLFSIATFLVLQFVWTGNFIFFVGSVVVTCFVLLSGKFASQVLVFFYLFLGIFLGSIWFILVVPLGFLLALVVTGGLYFRVAKVHFRFLRFWRSSIVSRYPGLMDRPSLFLIAAALLKETGQRKKNLKELLSHPFVNSFLHVLLLVVWLIALIGEATNSFFLGLSLWIIAGIVAFAACSTKPLFFLGNAERYLEYFAFPLSIISAYAIVNLNLYLLGLFVLTCNLLIVFVDYRSAIRVAKRFKYERLCEVIRYLQSIPESKNILMIPSFYTPRVAYCTHHKVVMFADNLASTKENEDEFLRVFPEKFDYPNENLPLLINTFSLNLIVVSENVDRSRYDLSKYPEVFSNSDFKVFRVGDRN